MARYVWHMGQWVEIVKRPPAPRKTPYIISDTMDALRHMGDGRMYDSKSAFRRATKEGGFIELGNDVPMEAPRPAPPPGLEADIAQAWQMVEQGYQVAPLDKINGGDFSDVETRVYDA